MKNTTNIDHNCVHCNNRLQSVFKAIPEDKLVELNEHKSCATYKKGQYIFTENGLPIGLYCVNSGKIKLTSTGFDGKEQILRLVNGGDILGYRALLSNERYHCSAVAIEDASICIIDKNYLVSLLESTPMLAFEFMKKISSDLKTAEEHIVSLSQKNVRERLAEALLFFKAIYGFETDGKTINVILSREEIADYVGTATESVIRLLSEFNSDKIIEIVGKKIKIVNLQKLLHTANLNE